jgi:hypothetical protein
MHIFTALNAYFSGKIDILSHCFQKYKPYDDILFRQKASTDLDAC